MQISDAESKETGKSEWEDLAEAGDKNQTQATNEYTSVCDIWRDSVHKLITKVEYQTPIYLQAYSQVHTEFLHCVDNLFGTCYIWQKQYFDRLGIDQKVVNTYGKLCESGINSAIDFLDIYASYKKFQADMAVNAMKIGNNYLHWLIDMFGKTVSFWSSNTLFKNS
jgi:hypothetical protein